MSGIARFLRLVAFWALYPLAVLSVAVAAGMWRGDAALTFLVWWMRLREPYFALPEEEHQ